MTQIFSGLGLGLSGSSLECLGGYGPKGESKLGQSGERIYLNAANGNVVLRHEDGFLSDHDLGLGLIRTYNSGGNFLDKSVWQYNVSSRIMGLSGGVNTSGSKVSRVDEAGHETTYCYDESSRTYRALDGSTARLVFEDNQWHYRRGGGNIEWRYDAGGRLNSRVNRDGLEVNYHYDDAGRLQRVIDSSGQCIEFSYDNQAQSVWFKAASGHVIQHTVYHYDSLDRLDSITQDLGPDKTYVVRYDYDGNSNRISDISQSDGTSFHLEYDDEGRVCLTRDGEGRTLRYEYFKHQTRVINEKNEVWAYSYNDSGELTAIEGPEGYEIHYAYEQHRLTSITQGQHRWRFKYNAAGDCIFSMDETGQVIERCFENHRLVAETRYQRFDGEHHCQSPVHDYYVYDESGHLRFKVDAKGTVTEFRYDSWGNQTCGIVYLEAGLDLSVYGREKIPSFSELLSWQQRQSGATDFTEYRYDASGQLRQTIHGELITEFLYDSAGRMREKRAYDGDKTVVTAYQYDGLGRVIRITDSLNRVKWVEYDDNHHRIITHEPNGLKTVQTFDKSGLLISTQCFKEQTVLESEADFGTTEYRYDALGRLSMTITPSGTISRVFYDAQGRKRATVSAGGQVTEYSYDAYGNLSATKAYARLIDTECLKEATEFAAIKPKESEGCDRLVRLIYDDFNRLHYRVDGSGAVIEYAYDAEGRVIAQRAYAQRLPDKLSEIKPVESDEDRVIRYFFDELGNKIGALDGEGYATEYRYNRQGLLTATIRYYRASRSGDDWQEVKPEESIKDIKTYHFYNGCGQKIADVDAEGYLSCYQYDARGNLAQSRRYYRKIRAKLDEHSVIEHYLPEAHSNDRITEFAYDELNRLCEQRDYTGLNTRYEYDEVGNVLSKTRIDTHNHNQARRTCQRFDAMGRVLASLDEVGSALLEQAGLSEEQIEAIWRQHSIAYTYTLSGQVATKTDQLGRITHYYYDEEQRLRYAVDADGAVVETRYNAFNQIACEIHYANKLTTSSPESKDIEAQVRALSDVKHDEMFTYRYTSTGKIASKQIGSRQSLYQYNAFGDLLQLKQAHGASVDDRLINRYRYDRRGLQIQALEDFNKINRLRKHDYDAFGRLKRIYGANDKIQNEYRYDKKNNIIKTLDGLNHLKISNFDAYNRLLKESDYSHTKYPVMICYDDSNNTVVKQHTDSGSITTQFNAFGDKITVTDGRGNVTEFQYNQKGLLKRVLNPTGDEQSYDFYANGLIKSHTVNGHQTEYYYDAANHILTQIQDVQGLKLSTQFAYDGLGRKISVTDPESRVRRMEYDAAGQLIRVTEDPGGLNLVTCFEYDRAGNKRYQRILTDEGTYLSTEYRYDHLNRLIATIIDPEKMALTESYQYDERDSLVCKTDPNGYSEHYVYDANGRRIYTVDALGGVVHKQYDVNGAVIAVTHYAHLIQVNDYDQNTLQKALAAYENDAANQYRFYGYDVQGRLNIEFDALGQAVQYKYDDNGNLITKTFFAKTLTIEQLKQGQRDISEDERGVSEYNTYDAMNRLEYHIDRLGRVTHTQYDGVGNLICQTRFAHSIELSKDAVDSKQISVLLDVDPMDRVVRFEYDGAERLHYRVDAMGAVTEYQYDKSNRVIMSKRYAHLIQSSGDIGSQLIPSSSDRVSRRVYDQAGREIYRIDSQGYVLERRYDKVGNVVTEIAHHQPLGLSEYTHASVAQALGALSTEDRVTEYRYDKANRLHEKEESHSALSVFEYDDAGNLIQKIDAKQQVWHYEYDSVNRLVREASPELLMSEYHNGKWQAVKRCVVKRNDYDAFGNVVRIVKDEGYASQTIDFSYDGLNRQTGSLVTGIAVDDSSVTPIGGMQRKETIETLTTKMIYDRFGNLAAQKDRAGYWHYRISDTAGQCQYEIDSSGAVINYEYDAFGNVTQKTAYARKVPTSQTGEVLTGVDVVASKQDRVTEYRYDKANQLTRQLDPAARNYNPKTRHYESSLKPVTYLSYNAFGECIKQSRAINTRDWADTHYYYDTNGRKTAVIDAESYLTEYGFDAFGQMSWQVEYAQKAQAVTNQSYVKIDSLKQDRRVEMKYDRLGYLRQKILKNVDYQQLSANGSSFVTKKQDLVTSYHYDALGQMTSITDCMNNTSYFYYDALGNVIAKVHPKTESGQGVTQYFFDSLGREVSVCERAKGVSMADDQDFQVISSIQDRITQKFYDNSNHAIKQIDAAGITSYYSYDANGNLTRFWQQSTRANASKRTPVQSYMDCRYQYDGQGNRVKTLTIETDGRLIQDNAAYNSFGEIIQKDFNGKFALHFEYDNLGRVWRTNKAGHYQIFLYDNLNNVTEVVESSEYFKQEAYHKGFDLSLPEYEKALNYAAGNFQWQLRRTDNQYDKLGRLLKQTRQRTMDYGGDVSQAYVLDRWGNVCEYEDWAGQITRYEYNQLNNQTRQLSPEVEVMDEHGVLTKKRLETQAAYDQLGRCILIRDGEGKHVAKRYDALGNEIERIDGLGKVRNKHYDLFGKVRDVYDELNHHIHYDYDALNRLTDITSAEGVVTHWDYNEQGLQIRKTVGGNQTSTDYDYRGNVIARQDLQGVVQQFSFDEGGHQIAHQFASGAKQSWSYDSVTGRLKLHQDLGGKTTSYTYNINGHLIGKRSDRGMNQQFSYSGDGLLIQFRDLSYNESIHCKYDLNGNLIHKDSTRLDGTMDGWMRENEDYRYDALGRLREVRREKAGDQALLYAIHYDYDAASNIRHVKTEVEGKASREDYFRYDANNRILINKGQLVNGNIQITAKQGSKIGYDATGNIVESSQYQQGLLNVHQYGYDKDNREIKHYKNHALIEKKEYFNKTNNLAEIVVYSVSGALQQYSLMEYANGVLKRQKLYNAMHVNLSLSEYAYDSNGNLSKLVTTAYSAPGKASSWTTHQYSYEAWDEYKQSLDKVTLQSGGQQSYGQSTRIYNANGTLSKVYDDKGSHSAEYLSDSIDGIRIKRDAKGQTNYLFVGGHNIGDVTYDKHHRVQEIDIYAGFTPQGQVAEPTEDYLWQHDSHLRLAIAGNAFDEYHADKSNQESKFNPVQLSGSEYAVQPGDDLYSIALMVYGDASLWYLIADANGLEGKQPLPVGTKLTIPPAANQHHTNATHRVYDLAGVVGDISATAPEILPPPPPPPVGRHHRCSLKQVIVGVVAVVATVATAGAIGLALGVTSGIAGGTGLFSVGSAVLAGAAGGMIATMAAGFSAGFVGSMASQLAGVALGMQRGVDGRRALATGLATAATGGILQGLSGTGASSVLNSLDKALPMEDLFSVSSAATAMLDDGVTQLTNMALHQKHRFDWDEIGGAGIGAGVLSGSLGKAISEKATDIDPSGFLSHEIQGVAAAEIQAKVSNKHMSARDVLNQTLGASAGNGIVGSMIYQDRSSPSAQFDGLGARDSGDESQLVSEAQYWADLASSAELLTDNAYSTIPEEGVYVNDFSSDGSYADLEQTQEFGLNETLHEWGDILTDMAKEKVNRGVASVKEIYQSIQNMELFVEEEHQYVTDYEANVPGDKEMDYSWESKSKHGICWRNTNKSSLTMNVKVSMPESTRRNIESIMRDTDTLLDKSKSIVAKSFFDNSTVELDRNGKITLSSDFLSKGASSTYHANLGFDSETGLPYVGASVSYQASNFKLDTPQGVMNITGTVTFNNEFIPDVSGLCTYAISAYRGIEEHQSMISVGLMTGGASLVAAPMVSAGAVAVTNTALGAASKLSRYVAAASVGGGLLGYSNYAAAHDNKVYKYYVSNNENSLNIVFKAYS